MALKLNPLTGQLENDDPAAPPLATPAQAEEVFQRPIGAPLPAASLPPVAPPPPAPLPASPLPASPPAPTPPAAEKRAPLPAPGPSADQRQLASIAADETAAAKTLGQAKVDQAGAIAAGKTDEVAARQALQDQEAARLAAREAKRSELEAQAAADSDAAKKAGFRGYWADKSTGTKILAAISVALGGIGQALQAKAGRPMGENGALQIINAAIAQDWQKQRASIEKLEQQAQRSGADAKHIAAEVGLMQAAHAKNALDLAAAQTEQRVAAMGPQAAAAASKGVLAALAREQMEAAQKLETAKATVADIRAATDLKRAEAAHQRAAAAAAGAKGVTEKPATEGQGKANAMLTVMAAEAKRIESLPPLSEAARNLMFQEMALRNAAEKNPTVDYTARLAGVRKTIESRLKGSDKQAYAAYTSFLDPLVRQRTGANAPPSEVAALAGPIVPAPGDRAEELAAKRQRRREAIESFAEQSNQRDAWRGRIGEIYDRPGAPATSAASGLPAGAVRGTYRGQRGYMLGGKFYPEGGAVAAR